MDYRLIPLAIRQSGLFWRDQCRVVRNNYRHPRFLAAWLWLRLSYLIDTPYRVSRRYQCQRSAEDLYVYGETPLATLQHIMERTRITSREHIFELGAGSGFTSLWLNAVKGCQVTALEQVPVFCWRLQRTARRFGLAGIKVCCENYLAASFDDASVIYLYGSNLDDKVIYQLANRFSALPKGVRVITVSYSLENYSTTGRLELQDSFVAEYEWGSAEVFIHCIR